MSRFSCSCSSVSVHIAVAIFRTSLRSVGKVDRTCVLSKEGNLYLTFQSSVLEVTHEV